jgi:hypothetical protein
MAIRISRGRLAIAAAATVLAAIAVGTVARRSARASGALRAMSANPATETASFMPPAQVVPGGPPLQTLRVWIHAGAVYPYVLHAMPGPAQIWVENETQSEVTLAIERVLPGSAASQSAATIGTADHMMGPTQMVVLGVGSYVFYEQSNPSARGIIDVRAP